MSGKPFVIVLGSDGQPVMPCTGKRGRLLLERGRAKVKQIKPFTIQLKDRSSTECTLQTIEEINAARLIKKLNKELKMQTLVHSECGLSVKAQEILAALKAVSVDPRTESFLEEYKGRKWLPMCNMLNGHLDAPDDYKVLLEKLSDALHGNLISPKGGNSNTYHELKVAGFKLWVTERDSFGPLGCAITCPYSDWSVSYG